MHIVSPDKIHFPLKFWIYFKQNNTYLKLVSNYSSNAIFHRHVLLLPMERVEEKNKESCRNVS